MALIIFKDLLSMGIPIADCLISRLGEMKSLCQNGSLILVIVILSTSGVELP